MLESVKGLLNAGEEPSKVFLKIESDAKLDELFIDKENIRLTEQHSIAGNPAKFSSGSTRLKQNRKELNKFYKFIVYLTLFPLYFLIISFFKSDRSANQ